jgi:hypothetical protein
MTTRQATVAIVCTQCDSRMKKLVNPFAIADLRLVCPGCVSELHVKAEDVKANLARQRLQLIGPDGVPECGARKDGHGS